MPLDFPVNPVDGQVYGNFYYSAAKGAWRTTTSFNTPNSWRNALGTTSTTTGVPLTIQGMPTQSANLQEWKNSSGTVLASIAADGTLNSSFNINTSGKLIGTTQPNAGSDGGIAVKAPASGSQTSAFLQFVNNAYSTQYAAIEATPSGILTLSASYVKMPNQPTFFAWQPESGTFTTTGGAIVFNSTQINVGSGYNTSTGRFTAPIAGVYQFNAQMLFRTNTLPGEATFFKNGANVISRNMSYSSPVGTSAHDPMHFMIYLSLAVGDYVDVRVNIPGSGADWYFGGGLGWFSGTLIG